MIVVNASNCPQNHRCPTVRVCPTGALQQEGFNAPFIEQELCIQCGKCTSSCPVFREASQETESRGNGHSRSGDVAGLSEGLAGLLKRIHGGRSA